MAMGMVEEEDTDSRVRVIPGLEFSAEEMDLKAVRDRLLELKTKYDSVTVSRNISALKAVSRVQHISDALRSEAMRELRRQEMIKQILDGEFA